MDEELKRLLAKLAEESAAGSDDSETYSQVVERLEKNPPPLPELLSALSGSARVQCALIAGSWRRQEPELVARVRELSQASDAAVRAAVCNAAERLPGWLPDEALGRLLEDSEEEVRLRAAEASAGRASLVATLVTKLRGEEPWRVRQEAAEALGKAPAAVAAAVEALLGQIGEDSDSDVRRACAESLEALGKRDGEFGGAQPPIGEMRAALEALDALNRRSYRTAARWLEGRLSSVVDLDKLRGFGRLLTTPEELSRLPRAYGVDTVVETILKLLRGEAPRAVTVLGEAGVGKTAVIYEVIRRLGEQGWHALALSPSDFLAGTRYLGEWESRLDDIVKSIKAPRRVVLYIPGLAQLSQVGTTGKSDANIASMLAPYIERGEVTVLGESGVEEFRGGLGAAGSLRRIFTAVELQPTTAAQTREVLRSISDEHGLSLADGLLDRLMELVGFYVTRSSEPGRSAGLLRRMLGERQGQGLLLSERDILAQLSGLTGIPASILDDAIPLDRDRTREFFESRVMGQPEAVRALVDVVTLVKAGLNDPDKPLGVMLFVGPTGVGKTELARALAELLFGDRERLTRIDMSEYATFDAFERLIGRGGAPGRLTEAVRERPFSVVLLDEIEKGHVNVFDLCLQIFDAGRLTDAQGRTSDFRRCIIILTSNVGSRVEREGPVGFGRGTSGPQVPERERVLRELERVFRPEFLNRLDRVVIFRPLDAETAAKIARREVGQVLGRSGISRRRLAVDVDESVFSVLLREGYSVAFGARPLKRTVERLVLVPLAEEIAAGKVPPGALLRLVSRQGRVVVEVTPPETEVDLLSLRAPPREGGREGEEDGAQQRRQALEREVAALRTLAEPLVLRKTELLGRSAQLDFWQNADEARSVLDDIYRLDGLLARLDSLDEALRAPPPEDAPPLPLDGLERQASLLGGLLRATAPDALSDAVLTLTTISTHGDPLDGLALLTKMYLGFARRERLDAEVVDEHTGSEQGLTMLVSGAGAWSLLAAERGLHLLLKGKVEAARKSGRAPDDREGDRAGRTRQARPLLGREVLRVEVAPIPRGRSVLARDEVRIELKPLEGKRGRFLLEPRWDVHAVHLPSMRSLHAWLGGARAQAAERAMLLLRSRLGSTEGPEQGALVRRYILGPVERVRDLRTSKSSARLDRVLAGELELLGR